ncbi:MAG: SUMF1/EgtB/PvdO family nonheme iron enzyme [Actinomycetota bacterium]
MSGLEFEWLELPMGRVVMGTDSVDAPDDERPSRTVAVGSLAVSPLVTVGQWSVFATASGYRTIAEIEGTSFVSCAGAEDPVPSLDWWTTGQADLEAPVTHVAWLDVYEFCRWADVRLLTEAEWAHVTACGAGLSGIWQWCDDWYSPDFFRDEQRVNPTGPHAGTHRVARGGGDRSTQRVGVLPDLGASDLGFRVLRRR